MAGDHPDAPAGTRYVVPQAAYERLVNVRDTLASIARYHLGAAPPSGWPPESPADAALYFRRLSIEMYEALGACFSARDPSLH
jgi:hypothetical protein